LATTNETNKIYRKLAQKAGVEGSTAFLQILRNQLSCDEARLLVELDNGATRDQLVRGLKIDEKSLDCMLEDLVKRKFLLPAGSIGGGDLPGAVGFKGYNIPKTPRFFPHGPDNPQTQELWTELFRSGYMQKSVIDSFLDRKRVTGLAPRRIIPSRKALALSPNIPKEQILWYEDIEQILKRQEVIATGKCGCRRVWGSCDSPLEVCLGFSKKEQPPKPGKRVLTLEEALALMDEAAEKGLVHKPWNQIDLSIPGLCNCCPCCCVVLQPAINMGVLHEVVMPSRFRAVIDEQKCQGCQTCVERCPFEAIEMRKVPNSKKMKGFILGEECIGCGLCIIKCPNKAMHLELVQPPDHIPTIPHLKSRSFSTFPALRKRSINLILSLAIGLVPPLRLICIILLETTRWPFFNPSIYTTYQDSNKKTSLLRDFYLRANGI
jgi:Pyruvate/2-oxoacid:ferredoxin oxidoreductase delta subunit